MRRLDMVELLCMLVLVCIFFPIGYRALDLQEKAYNQKYEQQLEDKNVKDRQRDTDSVAIAGGEYKVHEVLLATQIQNFYMPQPRRMSVGRWEEDNKLVVMQPQEITSSVDSQRDVYCRVFYNYLLSPTANGRGTQKAYVVDAAGNKTETTVEARYTMKYQPGNFVAGETELEDGFYYFEIVPGEN